MPDHLDLTGASLDRGGVARAIDRLRKRHQTRIIKVRLRRALTFGRTDHAAHEMGTFVPAPFHKSKLVIKYMGADPFEASVAKVALITANAPNIQVARVPGAKREVTKALEENADAQENTLNAIWFEADASRERQERIGWSQAVDGVGAYLTYPYDIGFGLPDRTYFEDLTDDQIAALKRTGRAVTVERNRRKVAAESADIWKERRREASKDRGLRAESLFVLEALGGGEILWEKDKKGLKYFAVDEEIVAEELKPGGDTARAIADALGLKESAVPNFGIRLSGDGTRIIAGISEGHMAQGQRDLDNGTVRLVRLFTRDEVFYYADTGIGTEGGDILFWANHGHPGIPAALVGGYVTHGDRPEEEYMPINEGLFKLEPLINEVATLLSNVVSYNATGRWVAVADNPNAQLPDPVAGSENPQITRSESAPGMDPAVMEIFPPGYHPTQLTLDDGQLLKLLEFYLSQLESAKPTDAETGRGALSGPAWSRQLALAQTREMNAKPVEAHAAGVLEIARIWTAYLRTLNVPVWHLSAPKKRDDGKVVRALIEFDPSNATTSLFVRQSNRTERDRILFEQEGLTLLAQGQIDELEFHEDYRQVDNPREAVRRGRVARAQAIIDPMILQAVVNEVLSRLPQDLAQRFPTVARELADRMLTNSRAMQAAQAEQGAQATGAVASGAVPAELQQLSAPPSAPSPAPAVQV